MDPSFLLSEVTETSAFAPITKTKSSSSTTKGKAKISKPVVAISAASSSSTSAAPPKRKGRKPRETPSATDEINQAFMNTFLEVDEDEKMRDNHDANE